MKVLIPHQIDGTPKQSGTRHAADCSVALGDGAYPWTYGKFPAVELTPEIARRYKACRVCGGR